MILSIMIDKTYISNGLRRVKSIQFVTQDEFSAEVIDNFLVDDSLNVLLMRQYFGRYEHSPTFLQTRHTDFGNISPSGNN